MIFRSLEKSARRKVAVAMALVTIGLAFLIIGVVWPWHPNPPAHSGTDWNDFLHGFLIGIAIGLEAGGAVLAVSAARSKHAAKL
jgi:hypothetical protein